MLAGSVAAGGVWAVEPVMRSRPFPRGLAFLAALVAVGVLAVAAGGNQYEMDKLPLSEPFGCANCHAGATATTAPSAALNAFGTDFETNNRTWDSVLAWMDSDRDGCLNGVEIGDADGDGKADGHITRQNSNPGLDGDCTADGPDEKSWGQLKELFNTR